MKNRTWYKMYYQVSELLNYAMHSEKTNRIIESLLATMTDKFAEMNTANQLHQAKLVTQMQQHQAESLAALVKNVTEHMTPVTQRRESKEELMHQDIRTVPAETLRLMQPDLVAQTENIRLAIENTLAETEKRIIQALSPQAEDAQRAVHVALDGMKNDLTSMLKQLSDIHETLDRLDHSTVKESVEVPVPVILSEAGESPVPEVLLIVESQEGKEPKQ